MFLRAWLSILVSVLAVSCGGDAAKHARDAAADAWAGSDAAEAGAAEGGNRHDAELPEADAGGAPPQAGASGESSLPQAGAGGSAAVSGGAPDAGRSDGNTAVVASDGGTTPAACPGRPLPRSDSRKTLMHGGLAREYVVHVPPSYDGSKAVPLVIDIHGYTYSEVDQEAVSGWREKSDAEGFIVVYPKGLDASWNGGSLCCGPSQEDGVDDEGFMRAIVKQVSQDACIDSKRVYATGLSNGGALSFLLACRAADVFAATAPVSMGNGTRPCQPQRPVSIVMVRGLADNLVPYGGGSSYPSATDDLTEWKTVNACTGSPTKLNGVCDRYSECQAGAEVMLCTIPEGTHIVYSDATKAGVPVADLAWDMFKRHALP